MFVDNNNNIHSPPLMKKYKEICLSVYESRNGLNLF